MLPCVASMNRDLATVNNLKGPGLRVITAWRPPREIENAFNPADIANCRQKLPYLGHSIDPSAKFATLAAPIPCEETCGAAVNSLLPTCEPVASPFERLIATKQLRNDLVLAVGHRIIDLLTHSTTSIASVRWPAASAAPDFDGPLGAV